jgi:hypothetical protein
MVFLRTLFLLLVGLSFYVWLKNLGDIYRDLGISLATPSHLIRKKTFDAFEDEEALKCIAVLNDSLTKHFCFLNGYAYATKLFDSQSDTMRIIAALSILLKNYIMILLELAILRLIKKGLIIQIFACLISCTFLLELYLNVFFDEFAHWFADWDVSLFYIFSAAKTTYIYSMAFLILIYSRGKQIEPEMQSYRKIEREILSALDTLEQIGSTNTL